MATYKAEKTGGTHHVKVKGMKSGVKSFDLPNTKPVKIKKGGKKK